MIDDGSLRSLSMRRISAACRAEHCEASENDRLWESTPPHHPHYCLHHLWCLGSSDICITQNPPHCQRAGNSTAIAISQAIADVGLCFVLQLRLSLTLRVPHSPLSSHICPIILSAAPMGALLYARVPNDEVECPTIGWTGVSY